MTDVDRGGVASRRYCGLRSRISDRSVSASLAMTSSPVASVTTMESYSNGWPVGATNPYRWGAFAISAEAMSFGT